MNIVMNYSKLAVKKLIFFFERMIGKNFIEYHHFPFNTLDVRLKDEDAEELYILSEMLEDLGYHYRVTDGIALGFYRDGHFIRHDNDLDFELLNPNSIMPLKIEMKNRGYIIGREVYYKNALQQIVFYNKDKVIADFVVWHYDGDMIVDYSERGYLRTQSPKYFETLTDFSIYGHTYKLPGYIEEWLVDRYGDDWRIPKTYKGDWKDECPDLKKL